MSGSNVPNASPDAPDARDPRDERLMALEEHAAFAERTVEHLSGEIAELNKRMHGLSTRVQSLEDRLRKLLEPAAESPESSDEA